MIEFNDCKVLKISTLITRVVTQDAGTQHMQLAIYSTVMPHALTRVLYRLAWGNSCSWQWCYDLIGRCLNVTVFRLADLWREVLEVCEWTAPNIASPAEKSIGEVISVAPPTLGWRSGGQPLLANGFFRRSDTELHLVNKSSVEG